nr:hypothetical protein [Bradyrhizobium sp. JYMT SZCCT0428]
MTGSADLSSVVVRRDVMLPPVQPLIGPCRNARIDIELAVFTSEEKQRSGIYFGSRSQ